MKKTWAIIVAAGNGSRLANAAGGVAKQFLEWRDRPLYWHSALALSRSSVRGIVFVFPEHDLDRENERVRLLAAEDNLGIPWVLAAGGMTRQDSARSGLRALPRDCEKVLVHDAARPFLKPALARRVAECLSGHIQAVVPVIPVTDTIKLLGAAEFVEKTLPRNRLGAAQTPQAFYAPLLRAAHETAKKENIIFTDDASLMEMLGHEVYVVPGDAENIKITNPEDLRLLEDCSAEKHVPCSGFGYDVHRFGQERPLVLGGVPAPGNLGVMAHSDGDVLLHALMDAILGCACLGDIGEHFPDTDPRFQSISSALLLDHVLDMSTRAGLRICHVDLTIVAQKPRIQPLKNEIRRNVARLLDLPVGFVNLKATTEEGLGFTGSLEGIKAYATVAGLRKY